MFGKISSYIYLQVIDVFLKNAEDFNQRDSTASKFWSKSLSTLNFV